MTRPDRLTFQTHRQPRQPRCLRKMQSPVVEYIMRRPRYESPPPSYAVSQRQQQQQELYALHRDNGSNTNLRELSSERPVRRRRRASHAPDWSYRRGSGPPPPPAPSPPPPSRRRARSRSRSRSRSQSVPRPAIRRKSCPAVWNAVEQVVEYVDATACEVEQHMRTCRAHGEDMYGMMEKTLNEMITLIDEGRPTRDLTENVPYVYDDDDHHHHHHGHDQLERRQKSKKKDKTVSYFSKVYLYNNSRLPSQLPPLRLSKHTPTYTLLRLAAQYSRQVYQKPVGQERQCYIGADWVHGTKAMVIKSIPLDDQNTIVFAIRGTQSFQDWAINIKTDPTSPTNFLDDDNNLCHAGFLSVARKMVSPVAARLRSLIAEDPNRIAHSLVITGHSAGGAVASLLFCHMLAQTVRSELTPLRAFFKRVHCVTFGAPPVSLYPLQLPRWNRLSPHHRSMFFAFINEGDPVPRAEKAYLFSLVELYTSPTTTTTTTANRRSKPLRWKLPQATLSTGGQLVLLRRQRQRHKSSGAVVRRGEGEGVEACMISYAQLRHAVFGDPLKHTMDLYARRIDELACSRSELH